MSLADTLTTIEDILDRHAERIAETLVAILAAAAIIFPRAIPLFYFALAVMAMTELWRTGTIRKLRETPGYFWYMAAIFTLWCLVTVLWSDVPVAALGKVLFLASTLIAAWIIMKWLGTISGAMARHIKRGLLGGIAFGAIFLGIEASFGQPLKMAFFNLFESARPASQKHIRPVNGEVVLIPHYLLNRSVAVLNILFWPAALLVVNRWRGIWRWVSFSLLAAIVALATFNSVHETSMIAFVLGGATFALVYFVPRIGRITVVTGWIVAVLLIIPATKIAYDAELYKAKWLPDTAHARIIFWAHTASRYTENPIGGVGLRSTKIADDETASEARRPEGHPYALRTGRHGHNIYLQTWYELGAVGAALLLLLGLAFLSRMNALTACAKPYAFATFTVAAILAAFTWGMWQVWYIAMFAFSAMAFLAAANRGRDPE